MTCEQINGSEKKTYHHTLFDQSTKEREKECMAEKKKEHVLEQQKSQQSLASEDDARQTAQEIRTSYSLHQENNHLKHLKFKILHLKTELDRHKLSLAALEHEKCKLQASEVNHVRHVQEEILEKQQLTTTLEKQGSQLLTLAKEHKELQLLYRCKMKESQGVVLQLQSHLKHVQTELDQVKCTLRTLKEKDDHVTYNMQKEIITRRRQIAFQQSKIRHLEKTKDKLLQEILGKKHEFQEITLIQTEKTELTKELEAVKSRNKHLKQQIRELEAVIYKMSGRFAGCQEFIQRQEQEYYRLKLKHIFDLKKRRPSSDFGSQFGAQHRVMSKQRPHAAFAARSVSGESPDPERVQSTAFSCDKMEVKGGVQGRRKRSQRNSHLKTNKLQQILNCGEPVTSTLATTTTSPQLLGRRSPVHTLLTSKPNTSLL